MQGKFWREFFFQIYVQIKWDCWRVSGFCWLFFLLFSLQIILWMGIIVFWFVWYCWQCIVEVVIGICCFFTFRSLIADGNSEMQCIYCWRGWILPQHPTNLFSSVFTLSFPPHPVNSVNFYRCRSGAGPQLSLIPQSHLSIGGVTPGFFLHGKSCNKSEYRSAKNTEKPGKHFINCCSLAPGWLGGFSKWVKEFSHQGQW